jgi:hypothetical protein
MALAVRHPRDAFNLGEGDSHRAITSGIFSVTLHQFRRACDPWLERTFFSLI